jgi:predicted DNA-binding transcriptional regulator YafY
MDYFERIDRLYEIHRLIQMEETGNPDELAKKLHLCRRQMYNLREELITYGAKIEYSRIRRIFFYHNDFQFPTDKLDFLLKK